MSEQDLLVDISTRLGRLESSQEASTRAVADMASNVNRLIGKLDQSDDIAREALQRVKSAQHQINNMKSSRRWLIGTTLTAIGLFFTAIGLLWKVVG